MVFTGGVQSVAVGVEVGGVVARTGIHVRGGGGKVVCVGVRQPARGVHVAVKDARYRLCARRTGGGYHEAAVQPGDGVHKAELHNVGGVYQHDHVFVGLAHVFEQRLFLGGDLKVGARLVYVLVGGHALAGAVFILYLGAVVALARYAADHNYSRVGKALCIVQQRLAVIVHLRLVKAAELVVEAVQRAAVAGIGRRGSACVAARIAEFALVAEILVKVDQLGVIL